LAPDVHQRNPLQDAGGQREPEAVVEDREHDRGEHDAGPDVEGPAAAAEAARHHHEEDGRREDEAEDLDQHAVGDDAARDPRERGQSIGSFASASSSTPRKPPRERLAQQERAEEHRQRADDARHHAGPTCA
jgi:hypothetical protein